MKEIELRLTSVLNDFEETNNYRKKQENKANLKKERINFIPTLIGKFNWYKYNNPKSKTTKKTSSLSFLKGLNKKTKISLKSFPLNTNIAAIKSTLETNEKNGVEKTSLGIKALGNDMYKSKESTTTIKVAENKSGGTYFT